MARRKTQKPDKPIASNPPIPHEPITDPGWSFEDEGAMAAHSMLENPARPREGFLWRYDSALDYLEHAGRPVDPCNLNHDHGRSGKFYRYPEAWSGHIGTVAAARGLLAVDGWASGAETMAPIIAQVKESLPPVPVVVRRRRWCDDGEDFDRDRWKEGREDYWSSLKRVSADAGAAKTYRIVMDGGLTGSFEAMDYFWSGALACGLTDALEEAGHRVELTVAYSNDGRYRDYPSCGSCVAVKLKAADQPLNIQTLAAWTAHPAAHRCVGFAWSLTQPMRVCDGYGRSALAPLCLLREEPNTIHIPRFDKSKLADVIATIIKYYVEGGESR